MSALTRTVLPRVLRPVAAAPARSFHQSARRLDNNPPPVHRAIIVDLDRVPTEFSNPEMKPTPAGWQLLYGTVAVVLGSWLYMGLTPKDWSGNLGYTNKEKEQQKKQKKEEEH